MCLVTEPNELYNIMLGWYFLVDMFNLSRIILLKPWIFFSLGILEPRKSSDIRQPLPFLLFKKNLCFTALVCCKYTHT